MNDVDRYMTAVTCAREEGWQPLTNKEAFGLEGLIPTNSILVKIRSDKSTIRSEIMYSKLGTGESAALLIWQVPDGTVLFKGARCLRRK